MGDGPVIFTIGHSTHSAERFLAMLKGAGITAVADVRSVPYARHTPQFNRPALKDALKAEGIAYSFLGESLGARPADRACYRDGVAAYDLIAATTAFRDGLDRVLQGASSYRIALMCAEKEPLDCHRAVLVARHLAKLGAGIRHILADGTVETQEHLEGRLLKMTGQDTADLFDDPLDKAYRLRGERIAFAEEGEESGADRKAAV
ncbi:DUF488 family protein [Magnetospirillum sp. UT-4]|uniref:DUF488 domain-containing protein n=1 Tax=Magnetospirillum sp. UT-4 TaxID=2681467 RepID=UPI001381ABB2|nr:DUF488 domain-containing protein [Magnetospirillum sp. UT-4]CAA7623400.1 conserved hypothetical protein [Magnetospirillum sp. UT-4]